MNFIVHKITMNKIDYFFVLFLVIQKDKGQMFFFFKKKIKKFAYGEKKINHKKAFNLYILVSCFILLIYIFIIKSQCHFHCMFYFKYFSIIHYHHYYSKIFIFIYFFFFNHYILFFFFFFFFFFFLFFLFFFFF